MVTTVPETATSVVRRKRKEKKMKKIHEQVRVMGMLNKPSTLETYGLSPFIVNITRDKMGCSLSIGCEQIDLQFTIPMERVMKIMEWR